MKKTLAILVAGAALSIGAAAMADDDFAYDFNAAEWWQKEGFGYLELFYSPMKPDGWSEGMDGGGFGLAGEYVNNVTHFGIGGRFSYSFFLDGAMRIDPFGKLDVDDNLLGLDVYVPVRLADFCTVYAGGGGYIHGLTLTADNNGKMESHGKNAFTGSLFAGMRLRWQHLFVFGEYRQDFGDVEVSYQLQVYDGKHYRDIEMDNGRFLAGLGLVF